MLLDNAKISCLNHATLAIQSFPHTSDSDDVSENRNFNSIKFEIICSKSVDMERLMSNPGLEHLADQIFY